MKYSIEIHNEVDSVIRAHPCEFDTLEEAQEEALSELSRHSRDCYAYVLDENDKQMTVIL